MAQQPRQSSNSDLPLFSEAEDPSFFSSQFWTNLVRYRPLLIIGGLWFFLICIAAVAYSRLMFTEPSVPQLSESAPRSIDPTHSQRRTTFNQEPMVAEPTEGTDPAATTDTALEAASADKAPAAKPVLPVWTFAVLISLCALGSFGVAHWAKTPRRVKVKRKKKRPSARLVSASARAQKPLPSSSTKRLQPFAPERDSLVVPGRPPAVSAAEAIPSLEAAVTPPPPPPRPPLRQRPLPPLVTPPPQLAQEAAAAPKVTVVPADEPVSLDWPEGSLAETLDLRQRRSLSSFL